MSDPRPSFKAPGKYGKTYDYPELDENLLLAAERLCTGANIHDVTAAKCEYTGWVLLAQQKPSLHRYVAADLRKKKLQTLLITLERQPTVDALRGKRPQQEGETK